MARTELQNIIYKAVESVVNTLVQQDKVPVATKRKPPTQIKKIITKSKYHTKFK